MFGILPLIALCLLCLLCTAQARTWRLAILAGAVIWGCTVWLITEVTSALGTFAQTPVALVWLVMDVGLALACAVSIHKKGLPALGLRGLGWMEYLLLIGVAVILALTGFVALVSPPNNFDSLTYHMTRVAHWAQNASVAHYPTAIDRQNFLEPLAEYIISHFYILAGGDALANFVQWLAFAGCVVGVSYLAGQLGGKTRAQILAAVFAATTPMAILQASTTQNDLVASFWLVGAAVFALRVMRPNTARTDVLLFGCAIGLGLLTKATLRLYAFPLLAWVALWLLVRARANAIPKLMAIAAVIIAINLPFVARNYTTYGSNLMPAARAGSLTNTAITPGIVFSNFVRNTVLHFGVPRADLNKQFIVQPITSLFTALGLDVNDPRSTHIGSRFAISDVPYTEDSSGNPLHTLVIFAAFIMAGLRAALRQNMRLMGLWLVAIIGIVLFCAVLRWQPWHTRLHLPLFILLAALVGVVADETLPRRVSPLVFAVLIIASYPFITQNLLRPLTGPRSVLRLTRNDLYFANADFARRPYQAIVAQLAAGECRSIGLAVDANTPEYLFWEMLRSASPDFRIQHVLVADESSRLTEPVAPPCAVVSNVGLTEKITLGNAEFALQNKVGAVGLYLSAQNPSP